MTLIIILHACFTANPRLFLEFNDYYLKILVYGYNFVCLVVIAYGKWTISFCSKSFIYKISKKLNVDILDSSLTVYKGGLKFPLFLCMLSALSVLISKIIVNRKKIKNMFMCKFSCFNKKQATNGEENVANMISTTERNTDDSARKIYQSSGHSLDTIGFSILASILGFIIFVRLLMSLDFEEDYQKLVTAIYVWSNSALERILGPSLPVYWLLRKEHSRDFVIRKVQHFLQKYFNTG